MSDTEQHPGIRIIPERILCTFTIIEDQDETIYAWVEVPGFGMVDLYEGDDVKFAAEAGNKWIRDRGLRWARDSAKRLDEVKRRDGKVLTLDVVR